MYLLTPRTKGDSGVARDYVNPKLDHAIKRIIQICEIWKGGPANQEIVTKLAAQSYIYLGYVVMDEAGAAALKQALTPWKGMNLNEDNVTPQGRLYRLRYGVERHFVTDPNDQALLADARRRIPVMFESMNRKAGHPCDVMHVLYLDGHVEPIPFGERWPAVQSFMDAFPRPRSTCHCPAPINELR